MTYEALTKAGVPLFAYGNFLTVCVNFLILAFIIFIMVQADQPAAPGRAAAACGPAGRHGPAARDPRRPAALRRRRAAPARRPGAGAERDAVPRPGRIFGPILGRTSSRQRSSCARRSPARRVTSEMNPIEPRVQAALDAAMNLIRTAATSAAMRVAESLDVQAQNATRSGRARR